MDIVVLKMSIVALILWTFAQFKILKSTFITNYVYNVSLWMTFSSKIYLMPEEMFKMGVCPPSTVPFNVIGNLLKGSIFETSTTRLNDIYEESWYFLNGAKKTPPSEKRYFHLFIGIFWGVSMSDFYWMCFPVILAPFLGLWVVYFLLQGPENGDNFGFFGRKYSIN